MDERQEPFDEYIKEFVSKDLNTKKEIVIDELKEMLGVMLEINKQSGINSNLLLNREVTDTIEKESDFVESVFVYLQSFKELLGEYLEDKLD